MAYFDCIVGGSGKGNTVAVTCAEEFAGLTITLSKTGKTYTKTCPSTAPYVVTFYGVENGTYTVSCTVDGQTYSETVIVQDISCVLNYGFNWKIWVDTASQLDLSDYDTLDEVLADEKALRELFLEHACVDYMASVAASNEDLETVINNDYCAKRINLSDYALDFLYANEVIADLMDEADKYGYGEWALMPQVPTMTSNTAPYGVASASSVYQNASRDQAYKAFDSVVSYSAENSWKPESTDSTPWIQYNFVNPIKVNKAKFVIIDYALNQGAIKFTIKGSNDGTTWSDALGETTITISDTSTSWVSHQGEIVCNTSASYSYLRLIADKKLVTSGNNIAGIASLQFYAWAPKGNVPIMTSNTAPYGTVVSNLTDGYKAFDGNDSTVTQASTENIYPYVEYDFTNPICLKKVFVKARATTAAPSAFACKIQYYDDSLAAWSDLASFNVNISSGAQDYNIDTSSNDKYALKLRMYSTTQKKSGYGIVISTLQFYGRELKESVPVMTSNTAPFGEAFSDQTNAYYVFDQNASTYPTAADRTEHYYGYDFGSKVAIRKMYILTTSTPANNYISYSDDKLDWTDVSITVSATTGVYIDISALGAHRYWRYKGKHSTNYGGLVYTLQFFGLDYSEKEFEVGATKKWLYDHGVELEDVSIAITEGGTVTKNEDSIDLDRTAASNNLSVATDNQIDVTDYNYYFCIVDTIKNSNVARLGVSTNRNAGASGCISTALVPTAGGNVRYAISISSVLQSVYVIMIAGNVGTYKIKELWLE